MMNGLPTKPHTRRRTPPGIGLSYAAIVLAPLAYKIDLGPVAVAPSDVCLALGALRLFPSAIRQLATGEVWRPLRGPLPFLACAVASACAATNGAAAVREGAQIALYAVVGTWLYAQRPRNTTQAAWTGAALAAAVVLAVAGCVWARFGAPGSFGRFFGTANALACSLSLVAALYVALPAGATSCLKCLGKIVVAAVAVSGFVLVLWSSRHAPAVDPAGTAANAHIPQRYLEGYAALSVLARHPLLGVGPGNYQDHIGEYYQGMPKDNTIVLGTRIGYGVLLASTGVFGLAAFFHWLLHLARTAMRSAPPKSGLLLPIGVLFVWGFFTPLLVGQILLPWP